MTDTVISVKIKAVVQDLLDKLKLSVAGTKDAVEAMRGALSGMGDSVEGVKKHHEGFTETLREFKSEQVQNARLARFYAAELVEIVPGAEAAKGAIRGLIGIGAAGFGIGAGVELAVFALGQLKEHFDEQEKQAKELKAAYTETFQKGSEEIRKLSNEFKLNFVASKADDAWTKIIDERNKKLGELQTKIEELENSSGVRKFFSGLTFGLVSDKDDDAIDQLRKQKANVRGATNDLRPAMDSARERERVAEHQEVDLEIERAEAALQDEIARLNAERHAKIVEINKRAYEDASEKTRLIGEVEKDTNERIKRVKEDRERQFNAQILAATKEFGSAHTAIVGETNVKVEAIEHQYRDRHSKEDQAQKQKLIDAELQHAQRKLEILQATHDKMVAHAQLAYQKMTDARTEAEYKEAQQVDAIVQQFDNARYGEQYAAQITSLRARYEQEKLIVRQALNDHVLAAEEANKLLAQMDAKFSKDQEREWAKLQTTWLRSFIHPLTASFQEAIVSMIEGTKIFGDAMLGIVKGVLKAVIDGLVQTAAKAIEEWILETVMHRLKAQAEVTHEAAVAGASAAAATAAIPFVGPFVAIEAGAAMAAAVEGAFMPMASAAQGYDIPAGVNPLVQTHAREMILPAQLADGIRKLVSAGTAARSLPFLVSTMDAKSFEDALRNRSSSLVRVLQELIRDRRL